MHSFDLSRHSSPFKLSNISGKLILQVLTAIVTGEAGSGLATMTSTDCSILAIFYKLNPRKKNCIMLWLFSVFAFKDSQVDTIQSTAALLVSVFALIYFCGFQLK